MSTLHAHQCTALSCMHYCTTLQSIIPVGAAKTATMKCEYRQDVICNQSHGVEARNTRAMNRTHTLQYNNSSIIVHVLFEERPTAIININSRYVALRPTSFVKVE